MWKMMLFSAVAGALLVYYYTYYTKGPTQKELFELRTQCAHLAKAKEEDERPDASERNVTNTVSSQYDVSANRCYVEIKQYRTLPDKYELRFLLFDGQTAQVLASTTEHGAFGLTTSLYGSVVDLEHHYRGPSFESAPGTWFRAQYNDAMDYINQKMGANRIVAIPPAAGPTNP
jgi:hypothetical protein